jgi:hypothetical protein
VVLRGGAAGSARVRLTGEGSTLPDPALGSGLPLPVEAQLLNGSTEACFAGAYGAGDVIENDGARFKARVREARAEGADDARPRRRAPGVAPVAHGGPSVAESG